MEMFTVNMRTSYSLPIDGKVIGGRIGRHKKWYRRETWKKEERKWKTSA
jgi:hypothetical protein